MTSLDAFREILRQDESLAPQTWLRIGGPAQYLAEPRNAAELESLLKACATEELPVHVLGSGSNVLVRDEGVSGVVVKLTAPDFARISIEGTTARAGCGVLLSHLVVETVGAGLAGMETLVGIPGTLGGAIRGNAGGRSGEIGQFIRSITVLSSTGQKFVRTADELSFAYRSSGISDLIILEAELELTKDDPEEIARRMRKLWIMKKSTQPLSFQSAGCIFKNPRGLSAGALIEQAGLKGTRVGQCEVSDRHGNFIVTYEGATSADVLRLIDLIRTKVAEKHGIDLELEIQVW
ncbi:UDP-N-acetylenolpyruvoylglucosamine reductase MurB [Caulifigura coniformis]|uniref:UDP-N-acetylenolpyruvoylglucosamine reductase n=1 Tax=Caulifigura coniformis TaxID=2527983 RepID=A0A517SHS5_9PLAN|nr:UDP-N-acetylmuramate dehydrogenase [Caulifigura coniformis]QDT55671.1 UDP-N-acetylenolpyruvoylglucosamine reductase MurB [Caulifigura coniformis]